MAAGDLLRLIVADFFRQYQIEDYGQEGGRQQARCQQDLGGSRQEVLI